MQQGCMSTRGGGALLLFLIATVAERQDEDLGALILDAADSRESGEEVLAAEEARARQEDVTNGTAQLQDLSLKDLELLNSCTRQLPGTTGCWLLSVIEALHYQGYIASWFKNGLIRVQKAGDEYQWSTAAGLTGTFKPKDTDYSDEVWYRPQWLQVLESIFITHFNRPAKDQKEFQKLIQAAAFSGLQGRVKGIKDLLNRIDGRIGVQARLLAAKQVTQDKVLGEWLQAGKQPIELFVVDKGGTHAIAVDYKPKYDADYGWCVQTYNQQLPADSSDAEDEYCFHKSACKSSYSKRRSCDSLWHFTFTGLPAPAWSKKEKLDMVKQMGDRCG